MSVSVFPERPRAAAQSQYAAAFDQSDRHVHPSPSGRASNHERRSDTRSIWWELCCDSVFVVGAGIRLSDGSVCQRWRAGGMCGRRTAWDRRSAGGFTVPVLLCQRRCAESQYLSDVILPLNTFVLTVYYETCLTGSCRVCWRWSWRYPPTALTPTVWRCWGGCGWRNLMWRRKPELWQRSESCSFSIESVFHTAASGAGANQFHIRVWFVFPNSLQGTTHKLI